MPSRLPLRPGRHTRRPLRERAQTCHHRGCRGRRRSLDPQPNAEVQRARSEPAAVSWLRATRRLPDWRGSLLFCPLVPTGVDEQRGIRDMSRQLSALGYRALAWIRRHPIASGIIGVFLLLLLIGSLAGSPPEETQASNSTEITTTPPTTSTTPSATPTSAAPSPTTPATQPSATAAAAPPPAPVTTQPVQQQAPPPAPAPTQAVQQQAPPPAQVAPQPTAQPTQAPPPPPPAPAPVSFSSCAEARAAGAAPLYRGQPGYSSRLDRDDDGVACE